MFDINGLRTATATMARTCYEGLSKDEQSRVRDFVNQIPRFAKDHKIDSAQVLVAALGSVYADSLVADLYNGAIPGTRTDWASVIPTLSKNNK